MTQFGSTSLGAANFATSLKVQPGIIKAINGSAASVATVINPRGQSPQNRASAFEAINVRSLDRLTFAFVDPSVATAQVKVTFAARVSGNVLTNYDSNRGTVTGGTSWNFGGDVRVHRTATSVFGNAGFGEVLQLDRWNAGGFVNTVNYFTSCAGYDACYNSGVQFKTVIMNVSRGNALWIQNYFGSQTSSSSTLYQAPTRAFPSADIASSIDFGHSAYTLVEMLTPGVTYTADSGATYLTSLPTVPEPASWAMMITGFGIVGCALRRRTRTAFAK